MAIEHKPSRNEEEYFARVDADLRKEMRAKADAERAAQADLVLEAHRRRRSGDGGRRVVRAASLRRLGRSGRVVSGRRRQRRRRCWRRSVRR